MAGGRKSWDRGARHTFAVAMTHRLHQLKYVMPENLEPSGLMQLLTVDYKFAVSFIILVAVLLIKPTGLFSGKVIRA